MARVRSPLTSSSTSPGTVRVVCEAPREGYLPIFSHPEWETRFPWLVQGTTARGEADDFDLRLGGTNPGGETLARWRLVREELGFPRTVCAGQVHGTRVLRHEYDGVPGLLIADSADGHATTIPGLLLAVSVADCIPVSIVDPERRAIALVHAGWRGVAGGIIAEGIDALRELAGSVPADLHLHLGPAICGDCYEVGPEVHAALGLEPPAASAIIDLRAIAARQILALGVPASNLTVSAFCTRCDASPFFSHRAGSQRRQIGVLGIRGE